MVRKTIIAGLAAAALIATPLVAAAQPARVLAGTPSAVATAAMALVPAAASGTGGTSGASPTAPAAKPDPHAQPGRVAAKAHADKAERARQRWLRDHGFRMAGVLHAQWTAKGKDGTFLTHEAIHGVVGTASTGSTSFTVTAADKTSQSYTTSATTKVWRVTEVDGKRHIEKATPAAVTHGAVVIVQGTGASGPFAAARILVELGK